VKGRGPQGTSAALGKASPRPFPPPQGGNPPAIGGDDCSQTRSIPSLDAARCAGKNAQRVQDSGPLLEAKLKGKGRGGTPPQGFFRGLQFTDSSVKGFQDMNLDRDTDGPRDKTRSDLPPRAPLGAL